MTHLKIRLVSSLGPEFRWNKASAHESYDYVNFPALSAWCYSAVTWQFVLVSAHLDDWFVCYFGVKKTLSRKLSCGEQVSTNEWVCTCSAYIFWLVLNCLSIPKGIKMLKITPNLELWEVPEILECSFKLPLCSHGERKANNFRPSQPCLAPPQL